MTIEEKVISKELEVKKLMDELKNLLNLSFESNKKKPNDFRYYTTLNISIEKLSELNILLRELNI